MLSSWGTAGTVLQGSFVQTHPENIHLFLDHCFIFVLKTTGHMALGDLLSCGHLSSSSLIPLYLESVCSEVEHRSGTSDLLFCILFWPTASFDAAVQVLT